MDRAPTTTTATATPTAALQTTGQRALITRRMMPLLCTLLPGVAARLAEAAWFRPPSPRITDAHRGLHAEGRSIDMMIEGRVVRGWCWGSGPRILLIHGWGSHSGWLQALVTALISAGFTAYAFDAPLHGMTGRGAEGRRTTSFIEQARVILEVDKEHGPFAAAVAHSGGCGALARAMRAGVQFQRVVLLAPMRDIGPHLLAFRTLMGLNERVSELWQRHAAHRLRFSWDDFDLAELPGQVPVPPLLVVHDSDDRETSQDDSRVIVSNWPMATLLATSGLGHRGILKDPSVVRQIVAFIADGTTPMADR